MSYIGTEPKDIRSFGRTKFDYTASQGQTAFTGADDDGKVLNFTVGQIEVYVNGILMDDSDFTTTGTGTVTLASAANLNDVVNVVSFETNIPDSNYVPASGGTFTGAVTHTGAFTSKGIDDNADATAITIDSSEHVSIGNTSVTPWSLSSGSGAVIRSEGYAGFAASGAAIELNRVGSDGNIANLRKDGTTVGTIGAKGGDLFIGTGDTGIRFYDGGDAIIPTTTDGASSDNARDLGAATIRFKDLYLSGGAYIGGTGAANKLDDYEEGTYTPTYTNGSVSYSTQYGNYVKIGTFCRVWFDFTISSASGQSGTPTITLPFTAKSGDHDMGAFTPWSISNNYTGGRTPTQWITVNTSYMMMYTWAGDSADSHATWSLNTTGRVSGSVSYTTA